MSETGTEPAAILAPHHVLASMVAAMDEAGPGALLSTTRWRMLVGALREAERLGYRLNGPKPSGDDDAEWAATVEAAARRPHCSQCGQPWSASACGPTHAVIAAAAERGGSDERR